LSPTVPVFRCFVFLSDPRPPPHKVPHKVLRLNGYPPDLSPISWSITPFLMVKCCSYHIQPPPFLWACAWFGGPPPSSVAGHPKSLEPSLILGTCSMPPPNAGACPGNLHIPVALFSPCLLRWLLYGCACSSKAFQSFTKEPTALFPLQTVILSFFGELSFSSFAKNKSISPGP